MNSSYVGLCELYRVSSKRGPNTGFCKYGNRNSSSINLANFMISRITENCSRKKMYLVIRCLVDGATDEVQGESI
jgi:hypothetical protein